MRFLAAILILHFISFLLVFAMLSGTPSAMQHGLAAYCLSVELGNSALWIIGYSGVWAIMTLSGRTEPRNPK